MSSQNIHAPAVMQSHYFWFKVQMKMRSLSSLLNGDILLYGFLFTNTVVLHITYVS